MSDNKIINTPPVGRPALHNGQPAQVRRTSEGWQAYSNWLNRVQGSNAGAGGGRHGAITRNLNSWSHYKTWADKVRNSWDRDK